MLANEWETETESEWVCNMPSMMSWLFSLRLTLNSNFDCFFRFVRHVHHFYVEFCFKTLPYMVMKMFDRLLRAHSYTHTPIQRQSGDSASMPIYPNTYSHTSAHTHFMERWFKSECRLYVEYFEAFVIVRLSITPKRSFLCNAFVVVCKPILTYGVAAFIGVRLKLVGIFCSYLVVLLLELNRNERFFLHTIASLVV